MSVEALFVIVKHWELPECPSIMKKINKSCQCQTTEYYTAMVMISNDLQLHVTVWLNLTNTVLNQIQKSEDYVIPLIIKYRNRSQDNG